MALGASFGGIRAPAPPKPPTTKSLGIGGGSLAPPKPPKAATPAWGVSGTVPKTIQALTPTPAAKPAASAAAAPAAPASGGGSSSSTASPLDATYFQNIAANNLKVGNQISAWQTQSANLGTALQTALAQLAYQQPRDQLKVEQNANKVGALYSSVENQNQGNLLNTYTNKRTADTTTEAQKAAALQTDIANALQSQNIYNSGQYDAAVARATKLAAANPATGQAPIATTPPPAAAAPAPAPPRPTSSRAQPTSTAKQNVAKAIANASRQRRF